MVTQKIYLKIIKDTNGIKWFKWKNEEDWAEDKIAFNSYSLKIESTKFNTSW